MKRLIIISLILTFAKIALANTLGVTIVDLTTKKPLSDVLVSLNFDVEQSFETNQNGSVNFGSITEIENITLQKYGYQSIIYSWVECEKLKWVLPMEKLSIELEGAEISAEGRADLEKIKPISGSSIYVGMKGSLLALDLMNVNVASSNSREIFAKIAGLNIWESDGAGLQIGIGGRGLSPNRTSHFNVRQNNVEISADALGYPESYYSPPLNAVEKIELVRGAAALQFGTQFGGLLNYQLKSAPSYDGVEVSFNQDVSGYGLNDTIASPIANFNTYLSMGVTDKRLKVFAFGNLKVGSGWREHSEYESKTFHSSLKYQFSKSFKASIDLTHMKYLAQQAGGLTDQQFAINPRAANRARNWFQVEWNTTRFQMVYEPNIRWRLESNFFGQIASRSAVGFLGETQRIDPLGNRDLLTSKFKNVGNETRLLWKVPLKSAYLVTSFGMRFYRGISTTYQGFGNATDVANFDIDSNVEAEYSDFDFPNSNEALFVQTSIPIKDRFSIVPGVRYERINTSSNGQFRSIIFDGAQQIIEDTLLSSESDRFRQFLLLGTSASYKLDNLEVYGNITQNYRAINFSDIQIRNRSLVIDPNIQDEKGYNLDLGVRGNLNEFFTFDVSGFLLEYRDRIGEYYVRDELNRAVRYRTNIADAHTLGLEMLLEQKLILQPENNFVAKGFVNFSVIRSTYKASENSVFEGKMVELVPPFTLRTGLTVSYKNFNVSAQYSLVDDQFSDATNVGADSDFPYTLNGVNGIIPRHQVIDCTAKMKVRDFTLLLSVNNLTNQAYFTRRATGYPGPGIIPSDGRNIHFGINWQFSHRRAAN